jgi:hypothetical protein
MSGIGIFRRRPVAAAVVGDVDVDLGGPENAGMLDALLRAAVAAIIEAIDSLDFDMRGNLLFENKREMSLNDGLLAIDSLLVSVFVFDRILALPKLLLEKIGEGVAAARSALGVA